MKSSVVGGLEAEMATTGSFKAAADVQTIWVNCCWHGSMPWENLEEPRAPS